jgi:hypothetical protein
MQVSRLDHDDTSKLPHCARRIDRELSRTRNVCAFFAGDGWRLGVIEGVKQIIAANCLEFWIREKSKRVSSFLNMERPVAGRR